MRRDKVLIEADELLKKLDDGNLRIYNATILFFRSETDLTAYEQYLSGHIPGAAFFDHQVFSDPNSPYMFMVAPEPVLSEQIGNLGISNDSEVVFYAPGILPAATRAWWILRYAGHDKVRILNGGLSAWVKAGGEIEQGARHYAPATFKGRFSPHMFASKEDVMAAIEDSEVCTVNTLSHVSYTAAHITGSSCLPCTDLMQDMDYFLPDEQLVSKLKAESQYKRIITYCGGGIAATVNAVAHWMVGNENVAVYDGSMYEWVREGLPTTRTGAGNWAIWE